MLAHVGPILISVLSQVYGLYILLHVNTSPIPVIMFVASLRPGLLERYKPNKMKN
jgi:ABC-type Mn2+/Zn2+ transport system permease subunit